MLTLERARYWYPNYDAVHGFDHIERVYGLCEVIGPQENADMQILLAAALLHDARGSQPGKGQRHGHHIESAKFAQQILRDEAWSQDRINAVKHCIESHRFRKNTPPSTVEAKILFDADKLDVIGAIGVVRALAYANQVKQPAYAKPSDRFLKHGDKVDGEPHSAYHEYIYKLQHIASLMFTNTAKEVAKQRQYFLNRFFEQLKTEVESSRSRKAMLK